MMELHEDAVYEGTFRYHFAIIRKHTLLIHSPARKNIISTIQFNTQKAPENVNLPVINHETIISVLLFARILQYFL